MTVHAIGRQAGMIKASGQSLTTTGNDGYLHGALAGNVIGANRKLHGINAFAVSDETG